VLSDNGFPVKKQDAPAGMPGVAVAGPGDLREPSDSDTSCHRPYRDGRRGIGCNDGAEATGWLRNQPAEL